MAVHVPVHWKISNVCEQSCGSGAARGCLGNHSPFKPRRKSLTSVIRVDAEALEPCLARRKQRHLINTCDASGRGINSNEEKPLFVVHPIVEYPMNVVAEVPGSGCERQYFLFVFWACLTQDEVGRRIRGCCLSRR